MASNEVQRVFVDRDGVRTVYDPRAKWILAITIVASSAVVLVALMAILALRPRPTNDVDETERIATASALAELPAEASETTPAPTAPRPRTEVRAVHVDRAAAAVVDPTERESSAAAATEQPELLARDVIPALVAAGEKEGIAAFPPPGTDPPKSGILVPDDYQLPPGYVRHYQVTDDGKQLGAILMFSPDFEFVDQSGRPVPVPENRIVPPEMAPPGLPIRMLELPKEQLAPGGGGRR